MLYFKSWDLWVLVFLRQLAKRSHDCEWNKHPICFFFNYLLPAYLFRVSCVWMAILMMSSVSLHVPSDVWQHYDQLLRGAITKGPSAATRTGKLGGVRPPHKRFALLGGIWSEKHLIVLSVGAPPIDLTLIVLGHSDGCTTGLDTSEYSWTAQGQYDAFFAWTCS